MMKAEQKNINAARYKSNKAAANGAGGNAKSKKAKASAGKSLRFAIVLTLVLINSLLVVQLIEQGCILPTQRAQIEQKLAEIERYNQLTQETQRVSEAAGSLAYIERIAREKLGMVKKDDIRIYIEPAATQNPNN